MKESFLVIPWLSPEQQQFLDRAVEIWIAGGWSMWAIAFVAFVMCALGASMVITMVARGMWTSSDRRIARMVADPPAAAATPAAWSARRCRRGPSRAWTARSRSTAWPSSRRSTASCA
ncbi:MAG: hypothetical protein ACKOYN_11015 [Planctomycetota bacterium]